jgi:mannose-6-phosphate isomerase-like protein (cupin superfamily)
MTNRSFNAPAAHLIDPNAVACLDVLGPTIQLLTPLAADEATPCLMRGVIPPEGIVPLHSHADPETFILVSGDVEGLSQSAAGFVWLRMQPGDIFHVPGGARHAFRNRSREPAVCTIVSTTRLGRFFERIGVPLATGAGRPTPPSPERIQHFLKVADEFGYWNATPEENAQLGLHLSPAPVR